MPARSTCEPRNPAVGLTGQPRRGGGARRPPPRFFRKERNVSGGRWSIEAWSLSQRLWDFGGEGPDLQDRKDCKTCFERQLRGSVMSCAMRNVSAVVVCVCAIPAMLWAQGDANTPWDPNAHLVAYPKSMGMTTTFEYSRRPSRCGSGAPTRCSSRVRSP